MLGSLDPYTRSSATRCRAAWGGGDPISSLGTLWSKRLGLV